MDVESFESGFVAALLTKAGDAAPVGAPCALLVESEADIPKVNHISIWRVFPIACLLSFLPI